MPAAVDTDSSKFSVQYYELDSDNDDLFELQVSHGVRVMSGFLAGVEGESPGNAVLRARLRQRRPVRAAGKPRVRVMCETFGWGEGGENNSN